MYVTLSPPSPFVQVCPLRSFCARALDRSAVRLDVLITFASFFSVFGERNATMPVRGCRTRLLTAVVSVTPGVQQAQVFGEFCREVHC